MILAWFYILYIVLFKKLNWFQFNRLYLMVGLASSVILPLLKLGSIIPASGNAYIIEVGNAISDFAIKGNNMLSSTQQMVDKPNHFLIIYFSVSVFLAFTLLFNLIRLIFNTFNSPQFKEGFDAFSFFKKIYINPTLNHSPHKYLIEEHERAHAFQWHSLDILFLEIVKILCWANPIIWLYKSSVRENHEYLADQQVIQKYPDQMNHYKLQILAMQLGSLNHILINNFNVLYQKKRIAMIKKIQISQFKKSLFTFLFAISTLFIFACENYIESNENLTFTTSELDKEPEYPGGLKNFYLHFQKNIKYPKEARINHTEGKYYAGFIVRSDGSIADLQINEYDSQLTMQEIVVVGYINAEKQSEFENSTSTLGKEALKNEIERTFNNLSKFNPGIINGNAVETRMVLPITFKLQ